MTALFFICGLASAHALTHSRAYDFGSPQGNLVANWSFEHVDAFWNDGVDVVSDVNARFSALDELSSAAVSGAFVGRVTFPASHSGLKALTSAKFPLRPGIAYTFSFYYQLKKMISMNSGRGKSAAGGRQ